MFYLMHSFKNGQWLLFWFLFPLFLHFLRFLLLSDSNCRGKTSVQITIFSCMVFVYDFYGEKRRDVRMPEMHFFLSNKWVVIFCTLVQHQKKQIHFFWTPNECGSVWLFLNFENSLPFFIPWMSRRAHKCSQFNHQTADLFLTFVFIFFVVVLMKTLDVIHTAVKLCKSVANPWELKYK